MAKLNPVAQKWVEALRSGKYEQATKRLRQGNRFCCLGVACDLYATEHDKQWDRTYFDGEYAVLPQSVQKWLGLKTDIGGCTSEWRCLSDENDHGATFDEIADLIEQHADELFVQDGAQ